MRIGIASPGAQDSVVLGRADPISKRFGKRAYRDPFPFTLLERIDLVVPNLFSPFPRFFVWEVRPTGNQESRSRMASKGACDADAVRQVIEFGKPPRLLGLCKGAAQDQYLYKNPAANRCDLRVSHRD